MIAKFKDWVTSKNLDVDFISENVFKIGDNSFLLIEEKDHKEFGIVSVFDQDFSLSLSDDEIDFAESVNIDFYCFLFGNRFYYTSIDKTEEFPLVLLQNLGKVKNDIDLQYSFLGIHGGYELCNGSGVYEDWVSKSKFLNLHGIAIAEKNTLAGTLLFQQACKHHDIPFTLGETVTVKINDFNDYELKLYALNQTGWFNILYVNKIINVDNAEKRFIYEKDILNYGEGVALVIDSEYPLSEEKIYNFKRNFDKVFYQLDFTQYRSDDKDRSRLFAIDNYLKNYLSILDPIIIQDAFYLEKEDCKIKGILNSVGSVNFQSSSHDQWFKNLDEIFNQSLSMFGNADSFLGLVSKAIDNTNWIIDNSDFEIETGHRHLPKFEWEGDEDNIELFVRLLFEALEEKGLSDNKEYVDRLEHEIQVILEGEVSDYFLILWDIMNWCNENNILTGVGRGSAAGCLVAYLLDITKIDPIEYNLLFERFLNSGRIKTSLPDIDVDFEGKNRDKVKRYMEQKYGIEYVCSVGTYSTFKIKSAIKDIGKRFGLSHKELNIINKSLELSLSSDSNFEQIFIQALDNPSVKKFVKSNVDLIELIYCVLKQPKTASIHACATLILPKEDQYGNKRNIFNWIPVKSVDGVLVSEWEGGELEKAGFLKEDILGIKQLDKFKSIFEKVKDNRDVNLKMTSVDLKDEKVYELFREGLSSDVFQFGSKSLSIYVQDMKPFDVQDMIAAVALFRPGPIESNSHMKFIKLKMGERDPEYDYMLESVTKSTYGLYIYQEQVMKAVQILGGFDLVTADDIRKAMGKKNMELIKEYKVKFMEGATMNGCDPIEAEAIWNKLAAFAKYAFNLSHSASYTYTGIMCQWLKANYPIEFWSTAFEYADDDAIPRFVSELSKIDNGVEALPPNINQSGVNFSFDLEKGLIYWAIDKIKFVGDKATLDIITEREENGEYFDIEEFCSRVQSRAVNKRVVENLILSGSFDEIYDIDKSNLFKRHDILMKYYDIKKVKEKDYLEFDTSLFRYNWYWVLKQKEISGLGHLNLQNIVINSPLKNYVSHVKEGDQIQLEDSLGKVGIVVGLIDDLKVRRTKKGDEFAHIILDSNGELIHYTMWPDIWSKYKDKLSTKGSLAILKGAIGYDGFKKLNTLKSNSESLCHVF